MNAYSLVKEDLKKFISKASSLQIIQNPRISDKSFFQKNMISSKCTDFISQTDYLMNYHISYEKEKYLCVMKDGSFFQINYEFDMQSTYKSYLQKMNLCYLPSVTYDSITNHYIRVDYDVKTSNSFIHPIAHMHIGFVEKFRMPLSEVMLFSEFFEFITYCFYEEELRKYLGKKFHDKLNYDPNFGKLTNKSVLAEEFKNHSYFSVKK